MELIKDYDCLIDYDLGRENFVIDAFSCKNKIDNTLWDHSDKKELVELRKIDAKIKIVPRNPCWLN